MARAEAPKYYRINEGILGLVEGAAPGTLIPTERALAQRYDTSRTTVRQASAFRGDRFRFVARHRAGNGEAAGRSPAG